MVTGRGTAVSIDERILQELKTLYQQEESKGNLFSRQQLAAYYATFRDKFGPEKLEPRWRSVARDDA